MPKMNTLEWVALILVLIGGLNWGLVGLFNYDLVANIFGSGTFLTRLIFDIVGLAALYMVVTSAMKMNKPDA